MTNEETAKKLKSIAQLDIDAYHAYNQAIDAVNDPAIRRHLTKYRDDHDRHVIELSPAIRGLGGTPPERTRDFKGFLIEGMTAAQSMTGTEGALKAMETNEKLTNKTYRDASAWDLPAHIKDIIDRGYSDEQNHLHYVQETLAARAGKRQEAPTRR